MRILYFRPDTVDCTADPHYVNYDDIDEMLKDVLMVLESPLVQSITSVAVYGHDQDNENDGILYEADDYTTYEGWGDKPRKLAKGQHAEEHKVDGLYFYSDAKDKLRIPPGLTGYKRIMSMIPDNLPVEDIKLISIGIVWEFSGQHSCSDYITIDPKAMTVDYSNQDDYIGMDGYAEHCVALGALIGATIEEAEY